jgi:hypothetical protein
LEQLRLRHWLNNLRAFGGAKKGFVLIFHCFVWRRSLWELALSKDLTPWTSILPEIKIYEGKNSK